ncbi:pyridoxal-phosphate dependent enzyme [Nocardioides mesophilus]|uniref:Pyridoxal-phosphate dependent enzyme n=1 Tax=Nocardioides mesophilus TaxID=433659 RepID=A0A7G9RDP7_9ACTN|nr:pyridoxal-phosphate dependent enzyme [Nocardioides mesophilus]QNN53722.1 pyridoxal-phosphate dependent enzyme [Nocardioides mesophilus]
MTQPRLPGRADVEAAAARIGEGVRRTPVLTLDGAELGVGGTVVLKLELTQHSGSFKARGALNSVRSLADGVPSVVAASGGNHGAAVAWAASHAGLVADVFVPATSTQAKLQRIEEYGARLHRVDGDVGAALDEAAAFSAAHGVPVLHPYDTFETVSGAGTLGLELEQQVPELDRVVIACGGGGLYAGVANALAGRVEVQPVEPELCPHLHDAVAAGEPVRRASSGVAADALGPPRIGAFAFATAGVQGAEPLLVGEEAILEARRWLWSRVRVLAEPASCVPLAAVLAGVVAVPSGTTTALVVSGGNNATLP